MINEVSESVDAGMLPSVRVMSVIAQVCSLMTHEQLCVFYMLSQNSSGLAVPIRNSLSKMICWCWF